MDSQQLEQLKPWIEQKLQGTSDMDPKDMAEYVLVLLQNKGTIEEQRAACQRDLEEFLHQATGDFVNALFEQIDRIQNPQKYAAEIQAQQPAQQMQPPQQPPQMMGGQEEFRASFRNRDNNGGFNNNGGPGNNNFNFGAPQQLPPQFANNPQAFSEMMMMAMQNGGVGFPGGFPQPPFGFQGNQGGRPGHNNQRRNNRFNNRSQGEGNFGRSSLGSVHNELSVANRRLIVEKLPDDKLNEEVIKSYFNQFGNLSKVRVDAAQHLAELEFESHDQAVAAHNSPAPIFDNRFIKVYWRRKDDQDPQEIDVEAVKRMQAVKQQQFLEREQKKKETQDKMQKLIDMRAKLLQEQEALLKQGAAAGAISEAEALNEKLKQQVDSLKAEAQMLGIDRSASPSARGGYRGGFRGGFRGRGSPYARGGSFRGRGSYRGGFANASLDLRPKSVLVKGVPNEKEEALRTHLVSVDHASIERQDDNSVLVNFNDRRTAEQFFNGEVSDVGTVEKSWVRNDGPEEMEM